MPACHRRRKQAWHNPRDSPAKEHTLTTLAQERQRSVRRTVKRRRGTGRSPLLAPVMVFAAAVAFAAVYVTYVLWPRWPETSVVLDAPSLPIVVSGTAFNVEPAAIRMRVQRRPGAHERVDLSYLWPRLVPPDPALKSTVRALLCAFRANGWQIGKT